MEVPSSLPTRLKAQLESKRGALAANIIIALMVIIALLVPPISAGRRIAGSGYTTVAQEEGGSIVDSDGMQVTLRSAGLTDNVRLKEESVPMASFLDGSAGKQLKEAAQALPSSLLIKSPIYQIGCKGDAPQDVVLTVPIPNNAEPYETLSLYTWNGQAWQFVPSQIIPEDDVLESNLGYLPENVAAFQSTSRSPRVSAELPDYVSLPELGSQALVDLNPIGYYLAPDESIEGSLPSMPELEGNESFRILPSLRNWTYDGVVRSDLVDNLLARAEAQEAHVQAIVDLVRREMYSGIDLDYRGIAPDLREAFTDFVGRLAEVLHAQGKQLTLHVEAPTQIAQDRWETGAYDWKALGQAVDSLKFPALKDPAAYGAGGQMEALLTWAVGEVERFKLQAEFTAKSIESAGGVLVERTYQDALSELSQVVVKAGGKELLIPGEQVTVSLDTPGVQQDPATGHYWFVYHDEASGQDRKVWLEDAASFSQKLSLVGRYNLGGVAVRDLWDQANDPRLWDLVRQYQASPLVGPAPVTDSFGLVWTVFAETGSQVVQESRDLSQPDYAWTAPEQPGTYQIGADIVVNDGQTVSGGEKLAFVVELPTPTPTPTATPTPVPTETPTPTPVPPTPTPKPTARVAKPASSGASASKPSNPPPNTAFGYGIQAHMLANGQENIVMDKVVDLGFGWIKQQVEWKNHEQVKGQYDFGNLDAIANAAGARGIKVLWSVVKAPRWAREGQDISVEGPPNNPADFADFLRAMASHFCGGTVKAIEVWNEQNLHYEWGNKSIDPAAYMELLKQAYPAIKQACPSMIVVSGALTPTGAPAPLAMDDFAYLEGMYQNGLKNFCDAVGSHPSGYNVAPSVGGGQAACDFITANGAKFMGPCNTLHHSWSFNATLNGYYAIMRKYGDGAKKIWPTEFGWATGWTGTPGYEYADDNSLQEQADWTVESYKLMKQWGFVGVAFLWNLNFRVVNSTGEVAQWGIVWPDWSATPAYAGLKAMRK